MNTVYKTVLEPILEDDAPFICQGKFISNNDTRKILVDIAQQSKTDCGTTFALHKIFTLESLFNAKSKTPGYTLMNVHQNMTVFKPVANSKSLPTEYLANSYMQSRALTLKFALQNQLIDIEDLKKYENYYEKNSEEAEELRSYDQSVDQYDDEDNIYNSLYIERLINQIDNELEELTLDTKKVNIESMKKLLINYKRSTFIHPARPRKCYDDIAKRDGKAMLYDTEYGRTVTAINKEDNQSFDLLWCVCADNEITPKDYTGKKYCVKKVANNQTNCLLLGTLQDMLDFLQR